MLEDDGDWLVPGLAAAMWLLYGFMFGIVLLALLIAIMVGGRASVLLHQGGWNLGWNLVGGRACRVVVSSCGVGHLVGRRRSLCCVLLVLLIAIMGMGWYASLPKGLEGCGWRACETG